MRSPQTPRSSRRTSCVPESEAVPGAAEQGQYALVVDHRLGKRAYSNSVSGPGCHDRIVGAISGPAVGDTRICATFPGRATTLQRDAGMEGYAFKRFFLFYSLDSVRTSISTSASSSAGALCPRGALPLPRPERRPHPEYGSHLPAQATLPAARQQVRRRIATQAFGVLCWDSRILLLPSEGSHTPRSPTPGTNLTRRLPWRTSGPPTKPGTPTSPGLTNWRTQLAAALDQWTPSR